MNVVMAWPVAKLSPPNCKQRAQNQQMNAHAQRAHHAEEHKAHIHQVAEVLVDQQLEVLQADHDVELAFAVLALPKAVRHFADAQARIRREHDVEQNLEADRRKPVRKPLEGREAHHEKSAHGIGERVLGAHQAQPLAQLAQLHAPACELAHAAAGDVARAHHQVEILFAHAAQHLGQHAFVVLQVRIHHGHIRRRRGQNSLNARRGQPAPPDPLQHAHIVVLLGQPPHRVRGAVGRVVVDKDHFVANAGERLRQPLDKRAHVPALVECGKHDRQIVGHSFLRGAEVARPTWPATVQLL